MGASRPDDDSVEEDEEDAAEVLPRSLPSLLYKRGRDRSIVGGENRMRLDLDRSAEHPLDFIASRRR